MPLKFAGAKVSRMKSLFKVLLLALTICSALSYPFLSGNVKPLGTKTIHDSFLSKDFPKDFELRLGLSRPSNFELDTCIGKGTSGVVYKGRQLNANGAVVFKIITDANVDQERLQKVGLPLTNEVDILKRLNILIASTKIASLGKQVRSYPMLILPYVNGDKEKEIVQKLKGVQTDKLQALQKIMVRACLHAIDALSRHRIVHNDINPGNLVFSPHFATDGSEMKMILIDYTVARYVPTGKAKESSFQAWLSENKSKCSLVMKELIAESRKAGE